MSSENSYSHTCQPKSSNDGSGSGGRTSREEKTAERYFLISYRPDYCSNVMMRKLAIISAHYTVSVRGMSETDIYSEFISLWINEIPSIN
jgi:hypothetical protein